MLTVGLPTAARADGPSDEVGGAVNAQRAAVGAAPLVRDAALDAAAVEWAQILAGTAGISHSTDTWRQARARAGWTLCCGENVAAGYGTAASVMSGWMGSPGHRANILDARYTTIGIGHVVVAGSPYGHYWVQIFATYPFDRVTHGAFLRTLYLDLLGRAGSTGEIDAWLDRMAQGLSRYDAATAMSRSDEWITSVLTRYYLDTLGRTPDAPGLAGWVAAARAGMPMAQIASAFYASPEYHARVADGVDEVWVRDLYRTLLLRTPDEPGVAHWLGQLAAGASRSDVALTFYQSQETARLRVDTLYRSLLGRPAESGGLVTWTPIVRDQGDLALAAWLASSEEYFLKAQP